MIAKRMISLLIISALYACSSDQDDSTLFGEENNYNDAIDLFAKRADSLDSLNQAKGFIKSKLESTKVATSDSIDMSVLLARLTYFEATRYYPLPTQRDARKKMFQENISYIDRYLSPDVLKFHHAAYYYFKLQSLLGYADNGTFLEQLQTLTLMNKLLSDKEKAGGWDLYAGGGLYRLEAKIKSREYYKGTPGAYSPEYAYRLVSLALLSEAYPGDYAGDLYCDNYLTRSELEVTATKNRVRPAVYATQTADLFSELLAEELIPVWEMPEAQECVANAKNFAGDTGVTISELSGLTDGHDYEFKVAAYFSSTSQFAGRISLEAFCVADYLNRPPLPLAGAQYLDYQPSMAGKALQLQLSLESESIPCVPRYLVFDSNRFPLNASFVDTPKFIDKGITNVKYAADTKKLLDAVYSVQLVNYSISMANKALAQPNMFCNIQQGEKNPRVDKGFLQKVKADYANLFGVTYEDPLHQFSCPPKETLKSQVKVCTDSPVLSTPFCDAYKLYSKALSWINGELVETSRRLAKINDKQSAIYLELQSIGERLQEEQDNSGEVLGD